MRVRNLISEISFILGGHRRGGGGRASLSVIFSFPGLPQTEWNLGTRLPS